MIKKYFFEDGDLSLNYVNPEDKNLVFDVDGNVSTIYITKEDAKAMAAHFGLIATGDIPEGALKQIKSEWYSKGLADGRSDIQVRLCELLGIIES